MTKRKNDQQSTFRDEGGCAPNEGLDSVSPLVEALKQAMHEHEVAPEVQEEALRTIAEAAKRASKVDAAQFEAITRSAEARAGVFTEAISHAATAEERERILKEYMKADERDANERRNSAERSTATQRWIVRIGGGLLLARILHRVSQRHADARLGGGEGGLFWSSRSGHFY